MRVLMKQKIAAVLLLVTTLGAAAVHPRNGQIAPRDIWDDAERVLQDFIVTVQASIDEASLKFNLYERQIAQQTDGALKMASGTIQGILGRLDAGIAEIRTYANGTNDDIIENCIIEYSDEIRTLPKYVWEVMTDCIYDRQRNATAQIDRARSESERALDATGKLRADVDGCYVAGNPEECISRVFIEILLQTLEVPTNIEELTRRTEDLVAAYYENEMVFCTRDRLNSAEVIASSILRIIRNCSLIS